TAPAASINSHAAHGGKRGGEPVFPPQHDTEEPQAVAADFPFKVAACGTRQWAAFSYARTTGTEAGKTGVLFQPSRMAGDKYVVRVMLGIPKAAMDCVTLQATLLGNHTNLPTAVTGVFRVFRKTDLIYMRKHATVPAMPLGRILTYWAEAGVKINIVNQTAIVPAAEYRRFLTAVIPNDGSGTARAAKLLDPAYSQSDGMHGLTFYSFSNARKKYLAEACQQYAQQKGVTKKFVSAINAYSLLLPGCHVWDAQISWYNGLGNKAKLAIETIRNQNFTNAGYASTQIQYDFALANPSKALLQKLAGEFMRNNVVTPGIFFFHSFCQFALRDFDGTLTQNLAGNGGLAPYGENTLDRALFLVYMDPVDPGGTTMHPEDVTAHEIGHNMSLRHAKCYRDSAFEGNGASADLHLPNLDCLMTYDRLPVKALCGFCVLRVRGWPTLAGTGVVALSNDANNNNH
ncbi:MAG: zinc-dependent metalloprotease family protein, partial [Bryobacteraceae bacterium]|nr:zinc-dependent metalloprotease family protein [Bryobacteraceae bacterium]